MLFSSPLFIPFKKYTQYQNDLKNKPTSYGFVHAYAEYLLPVKNKPEYYDGHTVCAMIHTLNYAVYSVAVQSRGVFGGV